jgi:DNA modification methylase
MELEWRPVSDIIPYARNARTHSDEQVAEIAASISEFGWTNPLLVDGENGVIAGHGRLSAARKLGYEEVPCIELSGLTERQKQAYILADNRLAQNAGWDTEVLASELSDLQSADFDLELLGFGEDELNALLAESTPEGDTDEDEAPEPEDNPVTEQGDTWLLGKHRVRCGDSTSADDVAALLNGVEPHLMVTDPPYGVNYDAQWRERSGLQNSGAYGKVDNDDNADWREAWSLFPGDVAYVWHSATKAPVVAESLEACGFEMRAQIVWAKSSLAIGRGHYHWQHEPCWYAVKNNGHWQGSRKESTLWQIDKPQKSETGHSTQKPVECMRRPIVNNSAPGQPVYDPFLGSGTTLIAGETEGRPVYGMELTPEYVDVIVKRWQDFTGKQAVLEGDGRAFPDIEQERLGNGSWAQTATDQAEGG